MIVKLITRFIVGFIVALIILSVDAVSVVKGGLIEQAGISYVDSLKVLIGLEEVPDNLDLFIINDKLVSVDSDYIYEDNEGGVLVHLQDNKKLSESPTNNKVYKATIENLAAKLFKHSYLNQFYLHYIILILIILSLAKDFIFDYLEKSAPEREKKKKEKQEKNLFSQIKSWYESKNYQKIVDKLDNAENRQILTGELGEEANFYLAISYLKLNMADKGLPLANKCRARDVNGVLSFEIGAYLSRNTAKAKVQDLGYLCEYLDKESDNKNFIIFLGNFTLKNQISDKRTIYLLIKHLEAQTEPKPLMEHILDVLAKDFDESEEAIQFYEFFKSKDQENTKPYLLLAKFQAKNKLFDKALDNLEQLLNLDYENQEVHDLLFEVHKESHKLADLFAIYNNVLEQVPGESIALTQLKRIKEDPDFDNKSISKYEMLSLKELFARKQTCEDPEDLKEIEEMINKRKKYLTVMFTDIKGYTSLSEKYPNDMMRVVMQGDQILPPIINMHEGVVIKKIGDAFMAKFEKSDSALIAAMQIQQLIIENNKRREAAGSFKWEIRIGINSGEMYPQDGDVYGDEVNVASRVESSGQPNEVFCTEATMLSVSNKKLQFEYVGEKEVKGKSQPIKLFKLIFDHNGLSQQLSEDILSHEIFNT